MSEEKPLISEKALKHTTGRYGIPETEAALQWIVDTGLHRLRGEALSAKLGALESHANLTYNRYETRKIQVARLLFQDSSETQGNLLTLVHQINGVSEPATVPHQTPEARVTPGVGDFDVRK